MRGFSNNRPATVDGGLGRVPASQVDTTGDVPAPKQLSVKDAERLMAAELLGAARSLVDSSTRLADQLAGRQGTVNGVLDVFLHLFASGTPMMRDYPVPVGSILVTNHGAAAVTYSSGDYGSDTVAPGAGRGKLRIDPHQTVAIAVAARQFTIWGTDADYLSVQAFTGLQAFGINS